MKVRYEDLEEVVAPFADPQTVWTELGERTANPFAGRRMLMWFGGALSLLASTIMMGSAGAAFGEIGFSAATALVVAGLLAGGWLLRKRNHALPGGLLATLASGLLPLLVFSITTAAGLEGEFADYTSYYDYISSQWVWMELVTIVVGILIVWKFDFGFALLPPALAAYFLVMDVGVGLLDAGYEVVAIAVGFVLGGAMLASAVQLERSQKPSHATWPLIYGLLSLLYGASELATGTALALVYVAFGLAFVVFGWFLRRIAPVTIGGITTATSLYYFTYGYFDGSFLFSSALFVVGIGIVLITALTAESASIGTGSTRPRRP